MGVQPKKAANWALIVLQLVLVKNFTQSNLLPLIVPLPAVGYSDIMSLVALLVCELQVHVSSLPL